MVHTNQLDGVLQMFDAAMHHALASPRVQAAMTTIVMPPTFSLDVKSSRAELDEARRGYEDALRLDPGLVEARLRLGVVQAARMVGLAHLSLASPSCRRCGR